MKQQKRASQDNDEVDDPLKPILGGDPDDSDDDELDDEELEAQAEVNKDREASDDAEIEDLAQEVENDVRFFVGAADVALGRSALLKVCICFECWLGLEINPKSSRSLSLPNESFTIRSWGMTLQPVVLMPSSNQN